MFVRSMQGSGVVTSAQIHVKSLKIFVSAAVCTSQSAEGIRHSSWRSWDVEVHGRVDARTDVFEATSITNNRWWCIVLWTKKTCQLKQPAVYRVCLSLNWYRLYTSLKIRATSLITYWLETVQIVCSCSRNYYNWYAQFKQNWIEL